MKILPALLQFIPKTDGVIRQSWLFSNRCVMDAPRDGIRINGRKNKKRRNDGI